MKQVPPYMKILVVDDDPVSRRVLRQILASSEPDCLIAEAACGEEACTLLEKANHGFDVVFLDIAMPDYDGLDLLARFRRSAALRTLPVILCTSSNDRATVIKAAAPGARQYIVKPPAASIVAEKLKMIKAGLPATTAPTTDSANPFTGGTKSPFATSATS
jgi:two-component system chemotaxis response regulator CheY